MPALLSSRAVVRVAGPDAASFLQGLLTQDVEDTAGDALFGALLSPQGKILFDFLIARADGAFLLDCSAAFAEPLVRRLSLYRLRARVEIELLSGWRVAAVFGSESAARGGVAFADPRLAALGCRMLVPAAQGAAERQDDYEAHRIRLGVPELGEDFLSDEVFLLDVNYDALNGVSYKKGCFVGQEVTSRMKRKGEIRRRTLIARVDGPPPAKGTAVTAGESTIGQILSGTAGAALALARLDRLDAAIAAGAPVAAGGVEIQLEFPDYLRTA